MNLKKIVSVFAAASMLAAMAVNASAYNYGSSEVTANGVKTTTYTWDFVTDTDAALADKDAAGDYDGLTLTNVKWTAKNNKIEALLSTAKNLTHISYTAPEDGVLTFYGNANQYLYIYTGDVNSNASAVKVADNLVASSGGSGNYVEFSVNAVKGTQYNVFNGANSWKISKVTFAYTEEVAAGAPEFSTSIAKVVSVDANGTADGTVGTGIVATITNNGTADGTISSIDWKVKDVKSDGTVRAIKTTGALSDGMPQVTLANGGSVNIALYISGLNNKNATAELKINDTWQTVE